MAGLHSLFKDKFTKFANSDYAWCHYVSDYFPRIMRNSSKIVLNPYKHNSYKYRLCDFLDECNIPRDVDWIVLMMNQLGSEKDFENLLWMYIPDMSDLEKLRQEFDTVQAHYKAVWES